MTVYFAGIVLVMPSVEKHFYSAAKSFVHVDILLYMRIWLCVSLPPRVRLFEAKALILAVPCLM